MIRLTLTPEQQAHVRPLLEEAEKQNGINTGVVFGQVQYGGWPYPEDLTLTLEIILAPTARKIRALLKKPVMGNPISRQDAPNAVEAKRATGHLIAPEGQDSEMPK
jgi:hypothetical protein